jgi:hypothetical protein
MSSLTILGIASVATVGFIDRGEHHKIMVNGRTRFQAGGTGTDQPDHCRLARFSQDGNATLKNKFFAPPPNLVYG